MERRSEDQHFWEIYYAFGGYQEIAKAVDTRLATVYAWYHKRSFIRVGFVYRIVQFCLNCAPRKTLIEQQQLYRRCRMFINPKNKADLELYDRWAALELEKLEKLEKLNTH